jgi:hypothetical protein
MYILGHHSRRLEESLAALSTPLNSFIRQSRALYAVAMAASRRGYSIPPQKSQNVWAAPRLSSRRYMSR